MSTDPRDRLQAHAPDGPIAMLRWLDATGVGQLVEHATGLEPARATAALEAAGAHSDWIARLAADLRRLHEGAPLGYVTDNVTFFGRRMRCDDRALLIRPYTEAIVERVLEEWHGRDPRVVELGCGAAAMIVTLALDLGGGSFVGTEIDERALELAAENAQAFGAPVELRLADVFDGLTGRFDVIVANLPYEDPARPVPEAAFEPGVALYDMTGEWLGINRRLLAEVPDWLSARGRLYVELPDDPDLRASFAGEPIRLADGEVIGRVMTSAQAAATARRLASLQRPAAAFDGGDELPARLS